MPEPTEVHWKLHLRAPRERVFEFLATDAGRARFWAESANELEGAIEFVFPNGQRWRGKILAQEAPCQFAVRYLGGSVASFELEDDRSGGTILTLRDSPISPPEFNEVKAGWVSVLMQLKAVADHGVDLRNHDPTHSWDQGFVEN